MASDGDLEGLKVYQHVADMLDRGMEYPQIRQELIDKGLDPQDATRLVDRLVARQAKEAAKVRAQALFQRGVSADHTRSTLQTEGHGEEAITAAIDELLEEWTRNEGGRTDPGRLWFGLGILLVALGFVLALGNRTGWLPTFSYLGTALMVAGAIVLMASRRSQEQG